MKWLWNWSKPKISSIVDNSQLEALRNDLTTLQNNVSNIQASLSSYLTNNQSYSLTNTSDKFIINVAKSANYLELQRGGNRKTTIGLGSSSSDNFSIESTGNIVLKPNQYIDANGSPIQNVASPTQANQVTTKQYVDNAIQNITIANGTRLSKLYGYVSFNQVPNSFQNLTYVYTTYPSSIKLTNGNIININDLKKYIISWNYAFEPVTTPDLTGEGNGWFVKTADNSQFFSLGDSQVNGMEVVYLTNKSSPLSVTWNDTPSFTIEIILSDTLENITNSINKVSNNLYLAKDSGTILEVTSWKNLE